MDFTTSKPKFEYVTFRGIKVYMPEEDFDMMKRFRAERIEDIYNCHCHVEQDGTSWRASYFGRQVPTKLAPGGEVDPTELALHFSPQVMAEFSAKLGEDPLNFFNWRSSTGGKLEKFYDY